MLYCYWCVCLSVRPLKIIEISEIMNVCLFVCLSVRMSVRGFWPI